MGFEKFISFLSRNLTYNCIDELNVNNSVVKVLANHVIFDLNFIIYHCIIDLENEINDILKIIYSLPYNTSELQVLLEENLNKEYWNKININFYNIFDGTCEEDISNKFKSFLNSITIDNIKIIHRVLFWKIYFKLVDFINNFHEKSFLETINIFIDGIPSYSKILEQRRRRTKNFIESKLRKKYFDENFKNMENDIIQDNNLTYNYFDWLNNKFSMNKSIGPSSEVIINLSKFLNHRLKNYFINVDININPGTEYGESDNKIFKFIHKNNISNDIVIHTCDSDLVHQILIQQTYFNLIQKSANLSVIRYYTRGSQCTQLIEAKKLISLIIKKYNDTYKKNTNINGKTNYIIIYDLMLLIYFFGNDYLPSSLEISYEISLNILINIHKKIFKNGENIVIFDINSNKIRLDLINFEKYISEIRKTDTFSIIVLNRFYKLPYQLINFLVERLNYSVDNLIDDFIIPYYIYEGYINEKNFLENKDISILYEKEDLRYIYYNKYKQHNSNIPKNPLDVSELPDNFKKQYENMKKMLDKFLDFFDVDNYGIPIVKKIQSLDENSYQDMYKYVCNKAENDSSLLYKKFYKPLNNQIKNLKDYKNTLCHDENVAKSYLYVLYYSVNTFFNDMSNFNPCNFVYYPYYTVPSLKSLSNLILKSNIKDLYNYFDNKIIEETVTLDKYFGNISHHLFITPYLKSSDFIDKIRNIPNLSIILDELYKKEGILWFMDDEDKNFDYRMIDPINFLNNWKDILIKINLQNKENIPNLNNEEFFFN
jgi:hypothetical protein